MDHNETEQIGGSVSDLIIEYVDGVIVSIYIAKSQEN